MSQTDRPPPNPDLEPERARVSAQPGALVRNDRDGHTYRLSQVIDFETVIGTEVESGRHKPLQIAELRAINDQTPNPTSHTDIDSIQDADWRVAEERYAAIKPLLVEPSAGREAVNARGRELGVNPSTLYRWLEKYRALGVVTALIPRKRGWREGKSRLPVQVESIVDRVIHEFYLTPHRPNQKKAIREVLRRCDEAHIDPPSESAIRRRLRRITEKAHLRGRGYREKAKNRFQPAAGRFPNADYPLAVVQIDHTPVDIILVDDVYRKAVGRPWITLAIDVHTRMVVGFHLSFDAPSETSVALCVAQSICPKTEWLELHGIDTDWPVWGFPGTIHVDNGPEFRSDNFRKACVAYGINIEFRPVRQPRYGGHIERLLGTLLSEIHDLPGTTFSSIKDRDGYDSEKQAVMTKTEFEEWLAVLICKVYHRRMHSSIGMTPYRKWEIGIFGNAETDGIGMPQTPSDRHTLLLDFLPSVSRTVQTFGVTIDRLTYYDEALRPWINASDPESGGKREFVFRRDPRDISMIWFFDPVIKQYYRIPFADQSLPSMSIWEYRQARAELVREGRASVNEREVLRSVTELRDKVEQSKKSTKTARRRAQRRVDHEKQTAALHKPADDKRLASEMVDDGLSSLSQDDIDDLGDIS